MYISYQHNNMYISSHTNTSHIYIYIVQLFVFSCLLLDLLYLCRTIFSYLVFYLFLFFPYMFHLVLIENIKIYKKHLQEKKHHFHNNPTHNKQFLLLFSRHSYQRDCQLKRQRTTWKGNGFGLSGEQMLRFSAISMHFISIVLS